MTMWFSLFRRYCRQFGIADSRLLWCLREEAGEVGGRMHLHALIGGSPQALVNTRTCFWLKGQWEKLGGGPVSRVRMYDAALPGVDYVCKGLVEACISEANAYESAKLAGSGQIMVSKSVVRVLSALGRRRAAG